MKMKKTMAVLLAVMMLLSFAACGGDKDNADKDVSVRVATGGSSGTYYAFGSALVPIIKEKASIDMVVQSTGASKANLQLIETGEVDIAIVQNDVMSYAARGVDLFATEGKLTKFSTIAAVYAEVCQIIANPSSGITSVSDLKGKKVSVGDAGSGVEFNAKQILEAYDITFDDIAKQNLSFADSAEALKNGQIDAFFCTAGAPTTAIMDLDATNDIVVLGVDDAHLAKLTQSYPYYTQYVLPAGTYESMSEAVATVAVKATFVASNDLSEDVVYNFTKALFENKDEIAVAHAKGKELDTTYAVEGIDVAFHPGAEKYFKEIGAIK